LAAADGLYFFSLSNWQQPTTSIFSVQAIGSSRQPLFFQFKQLAVADDLLFFSLSNWQQPTGIIFLVQAIGSSRQQVFFRRKSSYS
jgi:hypothetical protein